MVRHGLLQGCSAATLALLLALPAWAEDLTPLPANLAARTYDAACSSCHYRGGGRAPFGTRSPQMRPTPDELVQVILYGRGPKEGNIGMPAFGLALTDANLDALVTWLRLQVLPDTPWTGIQASITQMRQTGNRDDD